MTTGESPRAIRALIDAAQPMPVAGTNAEALLQSASELLFDHSLFNGHPRFFGYITSSPAPIGMLGDLLAAALNPNVGAWTLAPMATEIEAQTVRWIAELIGYPDELRRAARERRQHGQLRLLPRRARSGAPAGTFATDGRRAAATARCACTRRPRRIRGFRRPPTCPGSAPTASAGSRPTTTCGWTSAALRGTIDAGSAGGDLPFLVVGTAGSVSTGAIDPLPEIAASAASTALWFHVDGAYGAFAAACPDAPADLAGARARPTRSPSIRTSGSTRRSKPAAPSCATRERCATRSRITRPTTTSTSRRRTTSTTVRRTRAASAR